MHETSKRLSQTLKDVYEADWQGVEDLSVITEVRTRHCAHDFSAILTVLKCVCVLRLGLRARTCCGMITRRS